MIHMLSRWMRKISSLDLRSNGAIRLLHELIGNLCQPFHVVRWFHAFRAIGNDPLPPARGDIETGMNGYNFASG